MTLAAALCSVHVGTDWIGHDSICPTVSLEGENAGKVLLMQPDCRWSRRCSRDTTAEHAGFSHCSSSPPRTFSTTSDTLVNVVAVTGCMSLQEGHCMSSSSADVRTLSQTHSAHTSLWHGVVTGRSTMLLQMAHWKSERFRLVEGGRKRERERGAVIFQVPGASRWMALAMPFLLLLPGLPRLTGSFIFLPPRCSAELMVQTSHPSPCADQRWTFRLLSAPLIFSSSGVTVMAVERGVNCTLITRDIYSK